MLGHPAAVEAFTDETLGKLRTLLQGEPELDAADYLIQKARSREKQVYHPLLRTLRRVIANRSGLTMTYAVKGGRINEDQPAYPYKLEYSMVKREWYLLWHHRKRRSFMCTRLSKITAFEEVPVSPEAAERYARSIEKTLRSRRREVDVEILPVYNGELSRILYAFSSFEKKVTYDAGADLYRLRICVLGDEMEYLLSKIRFLGQRVRVTDGAYLQRRMLEASTKALARYGALADDAADAQGPDAAGAAVGVRIDSEETRGGQAWVQLRAITVPGRLR